MKNPTQKAILSIMGPEPMSALDIANQINFPREKIYYHLKNLEKANKIFVSETEIINGITKKKYLKVTSQLTQGASERGVSEKDTVQEQNIIPEITVLDQENEALDEDRGSAASVEDETVDEPVQEIPETTELNQEDEEFVQKEIGDNTLVQNLMKAKGVVPDTENEAQRTHPPDPSSPPETDIGRTIEKRRMSDDRRTTGERRKESDRRVEEKRICW